jgi:hypothetical protein
MSGAVTALRASLCCDPSFQMRRYPREVSVDQDRFDQLAVAFSRAAHRRTLLAVLSGALVRAGLGAAPEAAGKGQGKGRGKGTRDQAKRRRAKAKERRQERDQEPAATAKQCRPEGHPCEGNQRCCAPFVCEVSGPGNAERCTPCPSGTVYVDGTCCTPTTCAAEGAQCGHISDQCGGTLACGDCPAPQTCGGGTPGVPNVCGCTPQTSCPADACGTVDDGCGGTIACECTPGDVCVGASQSCQACTFETAQADACAGPRVTCGSEDLGEPRPNCHCARTTTGGAICTRTARTLCPCDPISEICPDGPCATDQDCQAFGEEYTHCIVCSGCAGGTACAWACIPCLSGQRNCSSSSEACCPNEQSCCGGVCCAPGERCAGPPGDRQCVPRV